MDPDPPIPPLTPPIEPLLPAAPVPVAPVVVSPTIAKPPAEPKNWKEVREWGTLAIAILALIGSIISITLSVRSSNLELNKYEESKAIIVVGEPMPDEKPDGMIFKFHAQDVSQRLNNLQITVPSVLNVKPWESWPANQQLTLFPISYRLGEILAAQIGRKPGNIALVKTQIPVAFDARYTVSGVSMERRGLYVLRALVQIDEDQNHLPKVDFQDFDFVDGIPMEADQQKLVDKIMEQGQTQVDQKPKN